MSDLEYITGWCCPDTGHVKEEKEVVVIDEQWLRDNLNLDEQEAGI